MNFIKKESAFLVYGLGFDEEKDDSDGDDLLSYRYRLELMYSHFNKINLLCKDDMEYDLK